MRSGHFISYCFWEIVALLKRRNSKCSKLNLKIKFVKKNRWFGGNKFHFSIPLTSKINLLIIKWRVLLKLNEISKKYIAIVLTHYYKFEKPFKIWSADQDRSGQRSRWPYQSIAHYFNGKSLSHDVRQQEELGKMECSFNNSRKF